MKRFFPIIMFLVLVGVCNGSVHAADCSEVSILGAGESCTTDCEHTLQRTFTAPNIENANFQVQYYCSSVTVSRNPVVFYFDHCDDGYYYQANSPDGFVCKPLPTCPAGQVRGDDWRTWRITDTETAFNDYVQKSEDDGGLGKSNLSLAKLRDDDGRWLDNFAPNRDDPPANHADSLDPAEEEAILQLGFKQCTRDVLTEFCEEWFSDDIGDCMLTYRNAFGNTAAGCTFYVRSCHEICDLAGNRSSQCEYDGVDLMGLTENAADPDMDGAGFVGCRGAFLENVCVPE